VKHYLQDVGSTFGMANGPHEWDIGWEHFYESGASRRRLLSFGFALSPWQTVPYTEYSSVGRFVGAHFKADDGSTSSPLGGQHDDRYHLTGAAQPPANGKSISPGSIRSSTIRCGGSR
jgi:hypothetical protein